MSLTGARAANLSCTPPSARAGRQLLRDPVALRRGVKAPKLPAASLPQGLARALVVAAAAAFIAAPHTVWAAG